MKLQRFVIGLLTALLLFAQQAGHAHAISHLGKEPAKEQLGHDQLCGKCVSFEKLSSAAPAGVATVLTLPLDYAQPASDAVTHRPRAVVAFRSRAPPAFL